MTLPSVDTSAVPRVRVTVFPLMTGAVALSVTVASEPPDGVFFTVKALLASEAAAARSSSKVMTRDVPFAAADSNEGAVVSVTAATAVPLTAITRETSDDPHELPEFVENTEALAISHPVEPPESSLAGKAFVE